MSPFKVGVTKILVVKNRTCSISMHIQRVGVVKIYLYLRMSNIVLLKEKKVEVNLKSGNNFEKRA